VPQAQPCRPRVRTRNPARGFIFADSAANAAGHAHDSVRYFAADMNGFAPRFRERPAQWAAAPRNLR